MRNPGGRPGKVKLALTDDEVRHLNALRRRGMVLLEDAGLGYTAIIKGLAGALEAKKDDGEPDHKTRLKAVELLCRLRNFFPPTEIDKQATPVAIGVVRLPSKAPAPPPPIHAELMPPDDEEGK